MDELTKKGIPKNPKKMTTSNIDKNNKLAKENQKVLKLLYLIKN
ncbi:hypothetical protein ABER75_11665 [Niallia taxi]|nr:hypothetical protein [Niallia taxi]